MGQVEGAFTMGLGYWLTEKLVFDKDSGQLLTHNTWVGEYLLLVCKISSFCIAGIQATSFQGHPD